MRLFSYIAERLVGRTVRGKIFFWTSMLILAVVSGQLTLLLLCQHQGIQKTESQVADRTSTLLDEQQKVIKRVDERQQTSTKRF